MYIIQFARQHVPSLLLAGYVAGWVGVLMQWVPAVRQNAVIYVKERVITLNLQFNDAMKCSSCSSCAGNNFAQEVARNLTAAGVDEPRVCSVYEGSVKIKFEYVGSLPSLAALLAEFPSYDVLESDIGMSCCRCTYG